MDLKFAIVRGINAFSNDEIDALDEKALKIEREKIDKKMGKKRAARY